MELEAQEGEWNFQGRDDVMVSIRKLQQTESEELCTGSLPQDGVITEERAGRCGEEVGRTLEGSGTPKAVTKAWGSGWSPQEVRVDAACQRWPHSTTQPAVPLRYLVGSRKLSIVLMRHVFFLQAMLLHLFQVLSRLVTGHVEQEKKTIQ